MNGPDVSIGNDVTMRGGSAVALAVIDQYEIVRKLGGGGFGSVYLAHDTVAGIDVAVKGLPPIVRNNAKELKQIRENFALVSRLHHPYIAAALHLQKTREVFYRDESVRGGLNVAAGDTIMVMEYAPGVTLTQWSRQFPSRIVPVASALEIVRQIAEGLDYAHAKKILHRDIKPANVMIETSPEGKVTARLLDFGLAAEMCSSGDGGPTEVHDTSGTRRYMAPEQWAGEKQGSATDQYALAVVFCELVAGRVPFASVFECGDPVIMKTAVCTREAELPEGCPFGDALRKALAKSLDERFGSCAEFVAALARTADSAGLAAVGKAERPGRGKTSAGASVADQLRQKANAILDMERLLAEVVGLETNCKEAVVHSSLLAIKSARGEMDAATPSRCLELWEAAKVCHADAKAAYDEYAAKRGLKETVSSYVVETMGNKELSDDPAVKNCLCDAKQLVSEIERATTGGLQKLRETFSSIRDKVDAEAKQLLEKRREESRIRKLEEESRRKQEALMREQALAERKRREEQEQAERRRREQEETASLKTRIEGVKKELFVAHDQVSAHVAVHPEYGACLTTANKIKMTVYEEEPQDLPGLRERFRLLEASLAEIRRLVSGHDVVVCATVNGGEVDGATMLYGARELRLPLRIKGRQRMSGEEGYLLRYSHGN